MKNLIYEKKDKIGLLKINRPQVLNALNKETLDELLKFLNEVSVQDGIKVLIVTGEGEKAFIAGADIKEMQQMDSLQMLQFCSLGQAVTHALDSAPFVTIAALFGYALGGGLEMALACDFIYAAQSAKVGLPEINLEIIPGFGGTKRLSSAVGIRLAKEMILTGKILAASEAYEVGLINKLCHEGDLLKECFETAEIVVKHSSHVISQAKHAINQGFHLSIPQALELERNMCAVCFSNPQRAEAMANFVNRSKKRNTKG
jgi:enoyl-CoA hydratase